MSRHRLTVVLADDHAPTRAGVRLVLESADFTVVAEADHADAAVEETLLHRPSLCLLDLYMSGGGLYAARRIRDEVPETAVVILTVSASGDDLLEAIAAGASGYLLKGAPAEQLPAALRAAARGEAAFPRTLEQRLVEEFRAREGRRLAPRRFHPRRRALGVELTDREWEVLELISKQLPTTVVAQQLGISEVTVRRHISSAVRKLGATDREGAVELLSGPTRTGRGEGWGR